MASIKGQPPNSLPNSLPKKEPTTRLVAMPTNTNAAGDIFGGWIMSQVDLAGSIVALRSAGKRVVTVAVNSFLLKNPFTWVISSVVMPRYKKPAKLH